MAEYIGFPAVPDGSPSSLLRYWSPSYTRCPLDKKVTKNIKALLGEKGREVVTLYAQQLCVALGSRTYFDSNSSRIMKKAKNKDRQTDNENPNTIIYVICVLHALPNNTIEYRHRSTIVYYDVPYQFFHSIPDEHITIEKGCI